MTTDANKLNARIQALGGQPQDASAAPSAEALNARINRASAPSGQNQTFRTVDDVVRAVAEGMTLGFADEIAAAANAAIGIGPGDDFDTRYQANLDAERQRDKSIPTGIRIAGNIVGGAVLPGAQAATMPGAIGRGVGFGAVGGFGTGEGGVEERFESAARGAAIGGAVAAPLAAASRAINPRVSPDVARLRAEGVRPTVGQSIGPRARAVEERARSLPITGGAIRGARERAIKDFNRAAINQAVRPAGIQLQRGAAVGREAIADVQRQLGQAYDDVLDQISSVRPDQQFSDDMTRLVDSVRELDDRGERAVIRAIDGLQKRAQGIAENRGNLTGRDAKEFLTSIRARADRFRSSADPFDRDTADVLDDLRLAFSDLMKRSTTPENAQRLNNIDRSWAGFKRVQDAASRVGAEDGVFTPAQLRSAVRAQDRSVSKGRFARGDAMLQQIAEDGQRVLGNRVPDSGTPERIFQGALLAGGGAGAATNPAAAATGLGALTVGAAPFTRAGQSLMDAMLNARQAPTFQGAGRAVRRAIPGAAVAGSTVAAPLVVDVPQRRSLVDMLAGP